MQLTASKPTIEDLYAQHCGYVEQTCARLTLVAYRKAWRRILLPGLGHDTSVEDVSRRDVRLVHAAHASTPAAANLALAVAKAAWILAEDLEWVRLGANPASSIRRHPEEGNQRPLTPSETRVLWEGCMDCLSERSRILQKPMAAGFALVLGTGMRRNEALEMRAPDFNFSAATATVRRHKNRRKRGKKIITMGPDTAAFMAGWLSGHTSEFAFPSPVTGRPYREPNRAWRRLCNAYDIDGATIRDARTGLATNALDAGEDLRAVQHQLGHASITTTARYARVTPRRAAVAAARIEEAVLRRTETTDG